MRISRLTLFVTVLSAASLVPATVMAQKATESTPQNDCEAIKKQIEALQEALIIISADMTRLQREIDDLGPKIDKAKQSAKPVITSSWYTEEFKGELLDKIAHAVRVRSKLINDLEADKQLVEQTKREIADLLNKLGTCPPPKKSEPPPTGSQVGSVPPVKLNPFEQRILDIHNGERVAVGAPPLRWAMKLEADATAWAQQLARTGQLVHAPREGRGIERENLSEGNLWWTTDQMMGNWLGEKRYFHAGIFPNVCQGDWSQCAHYSQIIWPTTTDLGCGEATGSGHRWLVCRYSPGGNKEGKPVGQGVYRSPERGR